MSSDVPAPATAPADLDVLLGDLRTLVECESPSADQAAVVRSARTVAEVGQARLGTAPEPIVVDGCTHLRWRFGTAPTRVLLVAHHDTVWPIGTLARLPFSIERGIVRGPGCFDMKAGLAMIFHALAGLDDRAGVTIVVSGDEEIGSPTSRALLEDEARGAAATLVLEPSGSGGALKTERKGASIYRVSVGGRAAHAGLEPERGVNATVELAHQVLAVADLADPEAGTIVTPSVSSAGVTTNTVPAEGSFSVDVRVRTAAAQGRIDADMRRLRPVLPGATVSISGGPNRPPLPSEAPSAVFHRLTKLAANLELPAPTSCSVGGCSDGNLTAGVGTPTLDGLGAVGGGAHVDEEHVVISEIPSRTLLLRALVADLLA